MNDRIFKLHTTSLKDSRLSREAANDVLNFRTLRVMRQEAEIAEREVALCRVPISVRDALEFRLLGVERKKDLGGRGYRRIGV